MTISSLYRKRLIPAECILLKDDKLVEVTDQYIITEWETINPKTSFSHGASCYLLEEGIKISKMYRHDGSLLQWYCDIVDYDYDEAGGSLTVTDLLADVIIRPDGSMKVVDLDELAQAQEENLITKEQMTRCLRSLDHLLNIIYRDRFDRLQYYLDHLNL